MLWTFGKSGKVSLAKGKSALIWISTLLAPLVGMPSLVEKGFPLSQHGSKEIHKLKLRC